MAFIFRAANSPCLCSQSTGAPGPGDYSVAQINAAVSYFWLLWDIQPMEDYIIFPHSRQQRRCPSKVGCIRPLGEQFLNCGNISGLLELRKQGQETYSI